MTYQSIVHHYETCLEQHGDTHLGVDWPRKEDALRRYSVMLDLIREGNEEVSLLDFGCGAAHLYQYIIDMGVKKIHYCGLDISDKFINLCIKKYPNISFYCLDILTSNSSIPKFDYIVMNGVFTEKQSMSYEEMLLYFQSMLKRVFPYAKKGIAFNVMSKQVDWERNDLFHLPLDEMAAFITRHLGRHFVVRNDYGLYEYTVYLYREPIGSN